MATCPSCRTRYPDDVKACPNDGERLLPNEAFSNADGDLASGATVGEYQIEEKIGEGGFGSVYRAVHPVIGKTAAIKVLNRQYSSNPQMVSRFIAEARAVNQIRHRNIIDIFSFGALDDGRQYYVMELLEGVTFDRFIKDRGRLTPEVAIPILRAIARALDAAHGNGIAHRDLKPENIFLMIDDEGTVFPKLLDFGIAKLLADSMSGHKTRTGTPIGTPAYMSPEQCRGKNVDHRTDIYSFGILAHEALSGALPFDGDDVMDLLVKQTHAVPPSLSSVCPELPPELDRPVLHMLEKDPAARPASIGVAIESLAAAATAAGFVIQGAPVRIGDAHRSGDAHPRVGARSTPGRSAGHTPGAASETGGGGAKARSGMTPGDAADLGGAKTMLQDGSGPKTLLGATADVRPSSRGRTPVLLALIVALGAGIAVASFLATRGPKGAPDVAAEPAAAALMGVAPPSQATIATPTIAAAQPAGTTEVTPAAEHVEIEIESVPAQTEVFLDQERLGVAPGAIRLRRGTEKVTLTLKAAGHRPLELAVTPDKNRAVAAPAMMKIATPGPAKPVNKKGGRSDLEEAF